MASFARIHNLNEAAKWTAGGAHAKPRLEFTVSDPDGDSIDSVILRIYTASAGGVADATYTLTAGTLAAALSAGYYDTPYLMKNKDQASNERWWTIEATAGGASSGESTRTAFKVCWAQAEYEFAVPGGASSSGWTFGSAAMPANTHSAFLFKSNASAGGAGGTYSNDISTVTPNNYVNVLVRLSTDVAGTQPALANMTFSYTTSASQPEKWVSAPSGDWALDPSGYRYGTKGFKYIVDENVNDRTIYPYRVTSGDDIEVQPNTDYVLSCYTKTDGPVGAGSEARLEIYAGGGFTTLLAQGTVAGDSLNDGPGATVDTSPYSEGWQRLHLRYSTGPGQTTLRPVFRYHNGGAGNGDIGWVDAFQLEEGKVVSPWHAGQLSNAGVLDNYGLILDAMNGAVVFARASDGATATLDDIVHGGGGGGPPTTPIAVDEIATPAAAAAGTIDLYAKANGTLYSMDDAGAETDYANPPNATLKYDFSSTTSSADPTSGRFRLNHATPASVTAMYISETDLFGDNKAALLAALDNSTGTPKCFLYLSTDNGVGKWGLYSITGSITDNGTWVTIPLTPIAAGTQFGSGDDVRIAFMPTSDGGGGGGAPTTADYLVGTANGSLSSEIVVGTTPGGELGGTWASPTVDTTHSGSTHAATQAAAEATAAGALSTHAAAADPHAGYVLESLIDAKGDLIVGTADNAVTRRAVGTNGQVLTADSTQGDGVKWATPSGGGLASGTAFPGSPASGDLYRRTNIDGGVTFMYDGTRWVTDQMFYAELATQIALEPHAATAAQVQLGHAVIPTGYSNVWLIDVMSSFRLAGGTALGASHKWVGTLLKQEAGTTVATINIDSGASSVYRQLQTAIGALLGTTDKGFELTWTKTGTPGNLRYVGVVRYRLVAT